MSAAEYLRAAVALMQQHALTRDAIDWEDVRVHTAALSAGAMRPEDTYAAIRWTLTALGDEHSFFSPPQKAGDVDSDPYPGEGRYPSGSVGSDSVGTVMVPSFRGSNEAALRYSRALSSLIAELSDAGAVGWIVDLTDNPGGNMLPMLAGLAPLLGVGVIGGFEYADGSRTDWCLDRTGSLWLDDDQVIVGGVEDHLGHAGSPVAVITGPVTASSGEAVAVAFRGRPRTRSFGLPTRGLSTSNEMFELDDGACLAITTARFVDRTGTVYGGVLTPDVKSASHEDDGRAAATRWIVGDQS
ncbi:MAG: S41 family peptidase [Actinomycetes bacterium]